MKSEQYLENRWR